MEFPSKTYNPSNVACVLNSVKVTVTASPVFTGQTVTILSSLLE
jgi:hypothetical protein